MDQDKSTLFVKLLAEHERRLQHYIRVLMPESSSADDILQESKMVMWQHFEKFEEGSNFNAWAHHFVFNRVLAYRKTKGRENNRFVFSDEFYEMLDDKYTKEADRVELKIETLHSCIAKLETEQRNMLKFRYFEKMDIDQVAEKISKTITATYRALSRIRFDLRSCVNKNINAG
ncbi:MAG: sigma-70 family RNA polymerase sigma factor [Lentisphaeraceae bacterium]|nr:sigma-70 family RNA polymerase sigma factor [Lentisphaeraceae bacterium]